MEIMMESAGSFVREGNVDGVMMLVRKLEREDKSKLMVDVVRELMRKEKEKERLNGKFLMELFSEIEKEDLEFLWSFLEELARQIVRRLVHHLENFENKSDPDSRAIDSAAFANLLRGYNWNWDKIGSVVEILVMEFWRELVRKQKETDAGYLVRNIMSGLMQERKMKLVVVLLYKVGCKDQELTGELLKYVARELIVENQRKLPCLVTTMLKLMEFQRDFMKEDVKAMWEEKWALALGEELAREDVMEVVHMLYNKVEIKSLGMRIARSLAMKPWRLGIKDLEELKWKQEWKLMMQFLWEKKREDRFMFPRDLWHEFVKEIGKESGKEKWKLVMEAFRELEMEPKYEFGMQLLEKLSDKLASERMLEFVMELLKEVLTEILAEEFGMEPLNRFVAMHYMEIITPSQRWDDLRNVVWMSMEAKLGEDGEELVMELLVVHAEELVRSRRAEQVLTEEQLKKHVKAIVRELMNNLSRDQKLQHVWFICYTRVVHCSSDVYSEKEFVMSSVDDSVMYSLNELMMEDKQNCEILWRLRLQLWKVPVARKLVRKKECKEVMSVVEALGKKRMWELAMKILEALLDWEVKMGSENVQLVLVFRKRQRDIRRKEEVKRKRSFRKFVDNKVVPRFCEQHINFTKQQVVECLQRSRNNRARNISERHIMIAEKALPNKLLECVYVDCDVFNDSHLETVLALYERLVFSYLEL